jgi:mono/diheme cytochrome c family protein
MPAFREKLRPDEIRALAEYVASLSSASSGSSVSAAAAAP